VLKVIYIFAFVLVLSFTKVSNSQNNNIGLFEAATWSLIQLVPSPAFYQDNNSSNSRLQFGLRWSITPLNYSFNANKMITPLQFFKVNPMRRYGGSVELFIQPEWATSGYKYADLERFSISPGIRFYFPIVEYGEYLSASVGSKYVIRKDKRGIAKNVFGLELGSYIFYGIAGFTICYNFSNENRCSFSFNLKYY
jgi:hypothetical protein